jgi:hypothetical protein
MQKSVKKAHILGSVLRFMEYRYRTLLYTIGAMVNKKRMREKGLGSTTTEVMPVEVRSIVLQCRSAGVEKM